MSVYYTNKMKKYKLSLKDNKNKNRNYDEVGQEVEQ
jgi:hypothetical protein